MNITEKILSGHLVSGRLEPGSEIGIKIDQTLTQDATGTMAFLQFEAMNLGRVRNELAVSYVDHNTVQVGFENADDHRYLQTVAAKTGAVFSRPGNGICHQLHLERFGAPGMTLLGADSHTPTGGGLGMAAIGAGGIDVAVAMGGGAFYLAAPRVINIRLTGRLGQWVTAKDVILKALEIFGTRGNTGCVFEYTGPGVATLDVPERAAIANMGAECGVTFSVFPSDRVTLRFLKSQSRPQVWREIQPDPDAKYEKRVELDLSELKPLAAAPHSPGNVVTVESIEGMPVHQVLIGSCTNASYRDLKTTAFILAGGKVHPDVSLGIAPGSRQTLAMLARDGGLADMLSAGARILETACGFCIGNSMSPGTDKVSLRTSNRNFEGRSGTASAKVFLVSPPVAALAALHGRIVNPLRAGLPFPAVRTPRLYPVDDSLFITPPADAGGVKVERGPNIGEPPRNTPLPENLEGVALIKVGDKITTDHIMPAGALLKYRSNIARYAEYVFHNVDPAFAARAASLKAAGRHGIIIAGDSYGQGSSREHAAMCPMFLGVKAVLAKTIERIHAANLVNFGILPLLFENPADYDAIEKDDVLIAPDLRQALEKGDGLLLRNETRNKDIRLRHDLTQRMRAIVLAGGLLNSMAGGG